MENKTVFSEIWDLYRKVILHSIVTSFGLDFMIQDQVGGDADTIRGVRELGQYKNPDNATRYAYRGEYDSISYHNNDSYNELIRSVRNKDFIDDAYIPGNRIAYGNASWLKGNTDRRANLDHVISAKEIHDDRGRVLANVDGVKLANDKTNLQFTNEKLNKSMGDRTIEEYIQRCKDKGEPLPDDVVEQMREKDSAARQQYERSLEEEYYLSDGFLIDAGRAAVNLGINMGLRQALGFIFIEVWFACEDEIKALPAGVSLNDCLKAVTVGIQKGFDNAKLKYKDILAQFEQGFVSGFLASIATILINIFITTDKNVVRYIRQASVTIVQVGNILLVNPDDLLLGDQLKEASVSLVTGASVMVGTAVGNQIAKTPIGSDKTVGVILQNFCASLVSGLMSCTLLIMIDRSEFINEIVIKMNRYTTADYEIKETSEKFIELAAKIKEYDYSEFAENVKKLNVYSKQMINANDNDLNEMLKEMYTEFGIDTPWGDDFDGFMSNPSNRVVFE